MVKEYIIEYKGIGIKVNSLEGNSRFFDYIRILFKFSEATVNHSKSGIIHLAEHYILDADLESQSFAAYGAELGAKIEGRAFWDRIEIEMCIPTMYTEKLIVSFLNYIQSMKFDVDTLNAVKQDVVNEINESASDEDELTTKFVQTLFSIKQESILGSAEDIHNISIDDMRYFFNEVLCNSIHIACILSQCSDGIELFKSKYNNSELIPSFPRNSQLVILNSQNGHNDYLLLFSFYNFAKYFKFYFASMQLLFGDGTDVDAFFYRRFRVTEKLVYAIGGIFLQLFDHIYYVVHYNTNERNHAYILDGIYRNICEGNMREKLYNTYLKKMITLKFSFLREIDSSENYLDYLTSFGMCLSSLLCSKPKEKISLNIWQNGMIELENSINEILNLNRYTVT